MVEIDQFYYFNTLIVVCCLGYYIPAIFLLGYWFIQEEKLYGHNVGATIIDNHLKCQKNI